MKGGATKKLKPLAGEGTKNFTLWQEWGHVKIFASASEVVNYVLSCGGADLGGAFFRYVILNGT